MSKVNELIKDEQMEIAFGNADFGKVDKRDVIKYSLLKIASGYSTGHTAECILDDLGLLSRAKYHNETNRKLSQEGRHYLWAAFSDGYNF